MLGLTKIKAGCFDHRTLCCVVFVHCCSRLEQCSIAGIHFYDFLNTVVEYCLLFLAEPGAQKTLLEVRKQRTPVEAQ